MTDRAILPEPKIRRSYLEQAQLSQAHRWLATALGAEQHSSQQHLLASEFSCPIDVCLGVADTRELQISSVGAQTSPAESELNLISGGFASGVATSFSPQLRVKFDALDPLLPLITRVEIDQPQRSRGQGTNDTAIANSDSAQLMHHRVLSLKHRWHALGESPQKLAPPYRQIITDNFVMDWGSGTVTRFDELAQWLDNSASSMAAARHDIVEFETTALAPNRYLAEFKFDWSGVSLDGKKFLQASSRHRWTLIDNLDEPYARIDRMDVELLVPFHVVGHVP